MARYAQRDEASLIIGFASHPSIHTDSVPVDEQSQEWLAYMANNPAGGNQPRQSATTSDMVIDILLDKGLILEAALTAEESDRLLVRRTRRDA